ncbi:hypothetical protein JCM11251_000794 [Rhodosporidiobolus azoricus]
METYASASMDSISYFSKANTKVFPALCNAAGFTDVDVYCNTGTADLCCGLCPNTSVAGIGQFAWAIISYAITAFCYTLSPDAVWGLAILQAVNANCFIAAGMIRVGASATSGGMTLWHTQFLWPQALGSIFIMAPSTFAPQWSRLGENHVSMTKKISDYEYRHRLPYATRENVREVELALWKGHHRLWSAAVLGLWFLCLAVWTGMYVYVSLGNIAWSQSNCEDVIKYTLSPTVSTCILGFVAWLLWVLDVVTYIKKEGISDLIIDHFFKGKPRDFDEHRKLERKITISVTVFLFVLWLFLNCWMWIEGLQKFLLTGGDIMTFGQVEQFTALFPDLLGFLVAVHAYLSSRAELQVTRRGVTSAVSIKSAGRRSSVRPSSNFPLNAEGRNSLKATNWDQMESVHSCASSLMGYSRNASFFSQEGRNRATRSPTLSHSSHFTSSGEENSHGRTRHDRVDGHHGSFISRRPFSLSSRPPTLGSASLLDGERESEDESDHFPLHSHHSPGPVSSSAPRLSLSRVPSLNSSFSHVGREGEEARSLGRMGERGESRRGKRERRRGGGEL